MTGRRGASVLEAIVALALGAVSAGVLAAAVLVGVRALSLASGVGTQVTATHDGLERLRWLAPGSTTDLVGAGPVVDRRATRSSGRGRPDTLRVESTWTDAAGPHAFTATSERLP